MKLDKIKGLFKEKGLLSGKKVLTATIIGTVLIASTGTALAASNITITDGKWENKLSHGRVEYVDADGGGEVVIDSADLDTLAVEVNTCNSKINEIITGLGIDATSGTVDLSLLQAGDVVLNPNGTIKSATGTGASVGGTFSGLLAKSVTVDCSDADVTADNLTAGVKAYNASGALITGTGADNENNYNIGYSKGYEDASSCTGVEYVYHKHTGDIELGTGCYSQPIYHSHESSCFKRCDTDVHRGNWTTNGWATTYECPNCGYFWEYRMSEQFSAPTYMKCTNQICVCGKSDEIVGYTLGCGKTEETVEEAIIKFVD